LGVTGRGLRSALTCIARATQEEVFVGRLRYYNQAVLEALSKAGDTRCFVPHSRDEKGDSLCSQDLAGAEHDVKPLLDRLIDQYERGNWSKDVVKIPGHPHCTHVVRPSLGNTPQPSTPA
jgi:hypothetical protein